MCSNAIIAVAWCCVLVGFSCVLPGCRTSSTWENVLEPTDKPGCALVLHVEKGVVVSFEYIMLGPPDPEDRTHRYSAQNLRHSDNIVTGEFDFVDMAESTGKLHVRFSIILSKPLEGSGPISAVIKANDDREGQEIVFVKK